MVNLTHLENNVRLSREDYDKRQQAEEPLVALSHCL